ncbi:MAG TPA: hypothetical protein PLD20_18535 [Blastocatellia bacterium]|nr:hypothetical protein [Blastocatellia bacterium]HMX29788.1 hypothetical protein [Blastocatellia bacterium]HMZ19941.1 hypothetical protein [Blastocatellia bacterium]HNG33683.1 hypothetical protein [Blastocatellia bacterium]
MQKLLFNASQRALCALFIVAFLCWDLPEVERAASFAQPACPPQTINGRLGSGSTDYPSVSGTLSGRLNRNGVASACNSPKTCSLATATGQRAYDAYTFRNSGTTQACVTVTLNVPQQLGANYQANSYLGSFNPNDLCANYLADPGVSSATLSVPVVYSHLVAAGATFVVVVQTTNPGEIGGEYQLKVEGLPNCAGVCALNCPANVSVVTTGDGMAVNYALPTTVGSCRNVGAVTCTPSPGSVFGIGTTAVNCSARNGAETISCSFNVAVSKVSATILEPAGCVAPGSTVTAQFTVTNSAGSAQSVTASAVLPPQLPALGGSCSFNNVGNGACQIVNPASVAFSGTLGAGQTATVSYRAQVADSARKDARLCIDTSVRFNNGQPTQAQSCVTVTCDPAGEGQPLPTAFSIHDGRPGSVLIYPIYTSSAANIQKQNTRLSLTNLDSLRGVALHLFLIDADTCQIRDFFLCLTANQTASFLASDIDPGTTGFIVAVAVDQQGCPINFNQLIGEEFVKFASGHEAGLGAEAIPAIAGGLPACGGGALTATLRFDGVSYAPLPRVVAAGGFPSRADGNNTLLILNRIGGDLAGGTATTSAMTSLVYDDAETPYSLSFNLTCQYRGSVWVSTRANPRFETAVPPGRSGWAKFYSSNVDEAFLGATINLNQNAYAQAGAFNAGHNLHKLSYTTAARYTIPILPPAC